MEMKTTSRKAGRLPGVLLAVAALIGAGTFAMGAALAADSVYNAPPANVIYQKPDSRNAEHSDTSDFSDLANRAYKADEAPNGGPTGRWVVHPAYRITVTGTMTGGMPGNVHTWEVRGSCYEQKRDYVYTFPNGATIISYSQVRRYSCSGPGNNFGWTNT